MGLNDEWFGKKEITKIQYIKMIDFNIRGECCVEYENFDVEMIKKRAILDFCDWVNKEIMEDYITGDEVNDYFNGVRNERN